MQHMVGTAATELNGVDFVHPKYWFTRSVPNFKLPPEYQLARFVPGQLDTVPWLNMRGKRDVAAFTPRAIAYHPIKKQHIFVDALQANTICAFELLGGTLQFRSFKDREFIGICESEGSIYLLDRVQQEVLKLRDISTSLQDATETAARLDGIRVARNARFVAWEANGRLQALIWHLGKDGVFWASGQQSLRCEPFDLGLQRSSRAEVQISHALLHDGNAYLSDKAGARLLVRPLQRSAPTRVLLEDKAPLFKGTKLHLKEPTALGLFRFHDEDFRSNIEEEFGDKQLASRIYQNEFLVCIDLANDIAFTVDPRTRTVLPLFGGSPDPMDPRNLLHVQCKDSFSEVCAGPRGTLLFGKPEGTWKLLNPHIGELRENIPAANGLLRHTNLS